MKEGQYKKNAINMISSTRLINQQIMGTKRIPISSLGQLKWVVKYILDLRPTFVSIFKNSIHPKKTKNINR